MEDLAKKDDNKKVRPRSLVLCCISCVVTSVSNPRSGSHLTHQSNKKKSKKSNKKKSKKVRRSLILSYLCVSCCVVVTLVSLTIILIWTHLTH